MFAPVVSIRVEDTSPDVSLHLFRRAARPAFKTRSAPSAIRENSRETHPKKSRKWRFHPTEALRARRAKRAARELRRSRSAATMKPMRVGTFLILVAAVIAWPVTSFGATTAPGAPTNPRVDWKTQFRAADAIGEALFTFNARAEERVRGKVAKPTGATTRIAQDAYQEALALAVSDVKKLPLDDADVEQLPDRQLIEELAALQSYNLRAFARLQELTSAGATTRPAIANAVAGEAVAVLHRPMRDRRWIEMRRRMRNAIVARSAASPGAPHQMSPQPNAITSYRSVPIDDPRWQPYYYGPNDAFGWFGGADPTGVTGDAAFDFRGGGGVYERQDQRVNRDYDTRTQGQFDRRVNTDADRRLNIHVDPRENF
jgi:hypothetical protein